nr:MAG TPA: hypothetical protein [Bacteriophage sp.]
MCYFILLLIQLDLLLHRVKNKTRFQSETFRVSMQI